MSALAAGSFIQRYQVEKVLGSGAFGIVYLASHKALGYQFHPESILTEHGHQMLKNFLDEWRAGA